MSKIAALQARLGGGAGIMMGLKPGGAPPVRKKKTERRHSLDNKVLNRPINNRTKAKRTKQKLSLGFDDEEKGEEDFGASLVGDIDASKAKSVSPRMISSTPDPSPSKSRFNLQMKGKPMLSLTNRNNKTKTSSKSPNTSSNSNTKDTSNTLSKASTLSTSSSPSKDSSKESSSSNSSKLGAVNRASKDFRGNLMSGRARSGTLKSSCELVSNDMDTDNTITVKFYHGWDKFYTSEAFSDVVKGFKITNIIDNVFGNELKDTGIEAGWQLVKIGKRKVISKNYTVIRGDLEKNSKFGGKGGYNVTFKCPDSSEDTTTKTEKTETNGKNNEKKNNDKSAATTTTAAATTKPKASPKSGSKPTPIATKKPGDKYDRMPSIGIDRQRSSSAKNTGSPSTGNASGGASAAAAQRNARGRSLAQSSAAQLLEENAKELKKTIKLSQRINEYIDNSTSIDARKGFKIDTMCINPFANELIKLGIKGIKEYKSLNNPLAFWTITGIGNDSTKQDLNRKNYINIRDKLTKEHTKNKDNFVVTFKANIKDIWIDSAVASPTNDENNQNSENSNENNKNTNNNVNNSDKETKAAKIEKKIVPTPSKSSAEDEKQPSNDKNEKTEKTPTLQKKKSGPANIDRPKGGVRNRGRDHSGPSVNDKDSNSNVSVELIDENLEEEWKEVRLKYPFDKYFNGERDDSIKSGMKGFMITKLEATSFGKDFRNLGISQKWRIWKINDLDVCKLNHMVLRNKLTMAAKARNTNALGYNITFISPNVSLDNLKNLSHVSANANDENAPELVSKPKSIDTSKNAPSVARQRSRGKSPRSDGKSGKSPAGGAPSVARQKSRGKSPRNADKSGKNSNKTELNSIEFDKGKNKNNKTNKNDKTDKKGGMKMKTVPSAASKDNKNKSNNSKTDSKSKKEDSKGTSYENNDEFMKLKKEIQKLKQENEQLKLENAQLRDQLQSRKGSIPIPNSTTNSADVASIQVAKDLKAE